MHPKFQRIYMSKAKKAVAAALLVLALILSAKALRWTYQMMSVTGLTPITVARLIFNTGAPLKQFDGRTNIALLGIGGGTHAGASLTDTMMILSFRHTDKKLTIISLPRDIWSGSLQDKINSAYYYGEEKKQGGGLVLSKVIMEEVVGIPVHYGLLIDFSGFKDVIDLVGGITINVPTAFTDPEFPIPGKEDDECGGDRTYACRYETLRFEAGVQTMDGTRALQYVRSRYAAGEEGSDFARARRQQEVLVSLKKRLTSPSVWMSPTRVGKLYAAFAKSMQADLNYAQLATVGKLLVRTHDDQIIRISLEDLLYSPPLLWYGRYVLLPVESFEAIHDYVQSALKN